MRELLLIALACVAGAALGAMFFGGLWWTVRKVVSSRQPALWLVGSLFARTGIVLAGLYLVSSGDWRRLAACLVGFVAARIVVTRVVQRADAPDRVGVRGAHFAP